jgi:uncharacterized cupin superfamily protein
VRRVNVYTSELPRSSERDTYRWRGAQIADEIGAGRIGVSLYDLSEGQRTFPYHFHHGMEEWVIVVEGTPTLRTPDGEQALRRGDVVCFPTGPDGAHQLRGPGRVLMVSANRTPETTIYVDSDKVGARPPGKLFRSADAVDYWSDE